jgi:LETM1-like protein
VEACFALRYSRTMNQRSPGRALELLWKSLEKNFRRVMQEIRETGELSVLLSRAARGQTLSADERKRMRAQLIDLARAIPALAIFAAPGGVLLLIFLAKVLPFSLLPSAFREQEEEAGAAKAKDSALAATGKGAGETSTAEARGSAPAVMERGAGEGNAANARGSALAVMGQGAREGNAANGRGSAPAVMERGVGEGNAANARDSAPAVMGQGAGEASTTPEPKDGHAVALAASKDSARG